LTECLSQEPSASGLRDRGRGGREESPVYAIMKMSEAIDQIKLPNGYAVKQYKGTTMPERTDRLSMKWDGEWHITVEVFRDLDWRSPLCWC